MYALKDIKKGNQVHGSYGNKPNEQLLSAYGFVDPKNKEKLPILLANVEIPPDDELFALKQDVLGEPRQFKLTVTEDFTSDTVQ